MFPHLVVFLGEDAFLALAALLAKNSSTFFCVTRDSSKPLKSVALKPYGLISALIRLSASARSNFTA